MTMEYFYRDMRKKHEIMMLNAKNQKVVNGILIKATVKMDRETTNPRVQGF